MDATQLTHLASQIEKLNVDSSYRDMLSLLRDLDSSALTEKHLRTTDLVLVLYHVLRTCPDTQVKKTVKRLLSTWKKRLHWQSLDDGGGKKSKCMGTSAEEEVFSASRDGQSTTTSLPEDAKPPTSAVDMSPGPPSDFLVIRSKCVQLLQEALIGSEGTKPLGQTVDQDQEAVVTLGRDVENHIFTLHGASRPKYKACVRSKVSNLRNPKGIHLRRGLLDGSLPPGAFARMSTEEMAGAELRQLRAEYSARGVTEHQLPARGPEGTPTRKVRCRRCGGMDCSVTQVSRGTLFLPAWVQQAGPDHDAVPFVTCGGCGEQWYHSGWVCL